MPPARIALWTASIAALAVLARTIVIGPYPSWVASILLIGYVALAGLGVAMPTLEMFGDAVWRAPRGAGAVALTFDDGPDPRSTREVLHILGQRNARATFFVVGERVDRWPDVVQEIHDAGHVIGVHGYSHDWLYAFKRPTAVYRDIRRAQDSVERACGVRPRLFRPPIGRVSPRTAAGARRAGVTTVLWSSSARDGVSLTSTDTALRRVIRGLRDGAIVLMHDASESAAYTPAAVAALPRVLDALEARGLRAVGLDELTDSPAYFSELSGAASAATTDGSSSTKRAPPV